MHLKGYPEIRRLPISVGGKLLPSFRDNTVELETYLRLETPGKTPDPNSACDLTEYSRRGLIQSGTMNP
jgi:hypothetical protein